MTTRASSVEEYLAALPADQRAILQHLRETISSVVPDADQVISYGVPMFKYRKRGLVSFGAAKNHCSFFVMSPDVMEAHADELKSYDTSKGTIRFKANHPLPEALVKKLVKARIAENEA
jgi:uncharacterized protein YdhG (YjbR/CyaY superfamily)